MPFKYLGVMVGCRHRKSSDWNYVVDKVRKRLNRWSNMKVSLGGRITLVKAVLSALPIYVLSIFRAPLSVVKKLTSLQQRFLWGGGGSGRKLVWAKWDALIASKWAGGLGMKDLLSFNKALLGKWAWRAIGGGEFLWLDIVRSNVGGEGCRGSGMELIRRENWGRDWWGAVLDSLEDDVGNWFVPSLSRKVGDGKSTLFWEDIWVGGASLRSSFPRLYGVCLSKGCTVAEVGNWDENGWVWRKGWRRDLRVWEEESLSNLTALLECRKQATSEPDSWEWKPETNKIFQVKSAYKILVDRKMEVNHYVKQVCGLIWNNDAAPKAQATAWRVIFRRIATRSELKRRGVFDAQAAILCPLCNQMEETTEHLFIECSYVASLWSGCLDWIGVSAPLSNNIQANAIQFCFLGRDKSHRRLLASLWVCIIWMIWKVRNEVVFQNGEWKHEKILGDIKSFMWNWEAGKITPRNPMNNFRTWCNKMRLC